MVDDLGGVGPDQGARCAKEGVEDVGFRPNFLLEVPSLVDDLEMDAGGSCYLVGGRVASIKG